MTAPTFSRRQLAQLFAGAAVAPAVSHADRILANDLKLERILVDQYWLQEEDEHGMLNGVLMGAYLYPDGRIEQHEVPVVRLNQAATDSVRRRIDEILEEGELDPFFEELLRSRTS